MSWQTYVDDHLLVPLPNGGQLSHAAIVGQDGGVWAQDTGFPAITVEETQALVKGCTDTSMLSSLSRPLMSQELQLAWRATHDVHCCNKQNLIWPCQSMQWACMCCNILLHRACTVCCVDLQREATVALDRQESNWEGQNTC